MTILRSFTLTKYIYCLAASVLIGVASEDMADSKAENSTTLKVDHYREILRGVILNQSSLVLLPAVQNRLLAELDRPFALGGKSKHSPMTPFDLSAGWELFLDNNIIRADAEITLGEIDAGTALQIEATITATQDSKRQPTMSLIIIPLAKPSSKEDLDKLKLNRKELEQIGIVRP